jgi:uncharacterized protein (TIGR02001 family)
MKTSLIGLFVASSVLAGTVHAEEAAAPAVATNFSLTTNYKYRGQDQGNNKPALQGGFDYTNSGFYIGNWNSSIGFTNAGIEMDFYGGYKGEIAKDIGFDVGALQYYYPQKDKSVDPNTTELYGAISFGPASVKYSHTVSKDYFALGETIGPDVKGRGTGYLDFSVNYEVMKGLTLNGHVGYTRLAKDLKDNGYENYVDYKAGVTYDLGSGFTVAGAFVGANKKDAWGDVNKGRAILTLTKSM